MPEREQKQPEAPAYTIYALSRFENGEPLCHRGGYETEEDALATPALPGYECVIMVGRDGAQKILKGHPFGFSEIFRTVVLNRGQKENVANVA